MGVSSRRILRHSGSSSSICWHSNLVTSSDWLRMLAHIYTLTYLAPFRGLYLSGDLCVRRPDGLLRISGRSDDVINVAGR
jgi:acyl-coenzyme A synthetase/AMP-(fatty) acid ligase